MSEDFISQNIDKGLGVLSFLILIVIVIYTLKYIRPLLNKMIHDQISHTEVIRNNTEAIKEVSRSNDNVATALSMLQVAFDSTTKNLERHDIRAENMEEMLIKIEERTCRRNG